MGLYEEQLKLELGLWKEEMKRDPSMISRVSTSLQHKINSLIPEKIHLAMTAAIKELFKAVIAGSQFTNPKPKTFESLSILEAKAADRIRFYSGSASAEGAITGAGGILLGLADFPLWLTIKMKLLYEMASIYGFDVKDVRERLFLLYIFQITFSNQNTKNKVFPRMEEFESQKQYLKESIKDFDWKSFQIEYRDYIDIAKMLQLIPGVGAAVGAIVNHRLTHKLGTNAMNAYRLRFEQQDKI